MIISFLLVVDNNIRGFNDKFRVFFRDSINFDNYLIIFGTIRDFITHDDTTQI